jgi:hypothetical protein
MVRGWKGGMSDLRLRGNDSSRVRNAGGDGVGAVTVDDDWGVGARGRL